MSIQGAFLSSLSSLNAQQSEVSLISNNIANAQTSGYSAKKQDLTAVVIGGQGQGVAASTVQRVTNAALTAAANQATGASAYSGAISGGLSQYSASLAASVTDASGVSSNSGNLLTAGLSGLETALTALAATPGDAATQTGAVNAARTVAENFNTLAQSIQTGRQDADKAIDAGVKAVNADLSDLAANETEIRKARALGQSTAGLEDKRDQLVSDISQYMPVRALDDGHGSIALTTDGGTTLYNAGTVNKLQFSPTTLIPDTLGVTADAGAGIAGGLSQVTVNGNPVQTSRNGAIAANLQLRDTILPGFSTQLNALAGSVITQFQSGDPSVSAGQTGLFTASGSAVSGSAPQAGLAAGMALNASVDPDQGGSAWRIQAGAQAGAKRQASDATVVNSYLSGLSATQSFPAGSGVASASVTAAAASVASSQQTAYATWSSASTTQASQSAAAQTALSNATGVNVDEQMQRLLLVQQTYAASSQVLQAAAQMLSTINSVASSAIA